MRGCSGLLFLLSAVLLLGQGPGSGGVSAQENTLPSAAGPIRTDLYGDPLPEGALQRLGTVRFRLPSSGTLYANHTDGQILAALGGKQVRLLNAATGKEIRKFDEQAAPIGLLALSRDGQLLAGSGNDGAIRLWDVASGKEVRRIETKARYVRCMCLSADGKWLAIGDGDKSVLLWETAVGKDPRRFSASDRGFVFAMDISPDGKTLAVAGDMAPGSYKVCLLDAATGKELRSTRLQCPARQVGFSPDGQTLMAIEPPSGGKPNSTIHLWDVANWKHRPLPDQPEQVSTAAFSPDGRTLASGSYHKICLWDVATGKLLAPFQGKQIPAHNLVFSPDGKTLATSNFPVLRFWDVATGAETTATQAGHQSSVAALVHLPDGKTLATAGRDQTVRLWNLATGKEVGAARALENAAFTKYSFSPDGKTLAWSGDKQVHLWDVAAGQEARRLPLSASCLAFSQDGLTLAIGGQEEQPLRLWDLAAGKERLRLPGRRYYDSALAYAPNGKYLASLVEDEDEDMKLRLFETNRGRQLHQWSECRRLAGFVFSPDSRFLAFQSEPRTLRLWELAARKERFQLEVPQRARALAFSHDGSLLALGFDDMTVQVFDLAAGRELTRFQGHRGTISALGFSADDRVLASASSDTTVLLWDVAALPRKRVVPQTPLTAQELAAVWDDLAADGGDRVQRAVWNLAGVPRQAELLVKERLKLPRPVEPQRLAQLIADLDADRFAVRQQAAEELEKLAEIAAPALEKVLAGKPSLETRQRIESLLEKLSAEGPLAPDVLRGLRAIEILERIGSQDAQRQLETLAGSMPPSRLTQEAQASLKRLTARAVRP